MFKYNSRDVLPSASSGFIFDCMSLTHADDKVGLPHVGYVKLIAFKADDELIEHLLYI